MDLNGNSRGADITDDTIENN